MNFNLHLLGWKAFQDLSLTVAERSYGITARSFSAGPDGGRDGAAVLLLRESSPALGEVAIQCKHTGSPNSRFTAGAVDGELPSIKKLVAAGLCDTYLLFTNRALSAQAEHVVRQKILDVGAKQAFILGREEIERRLTDDKELRGMIPRVYGIGDLSEIIDERLYEQTAQMLDVHDLARFVPTDAYRSAIQALDLHSFTMLLGEPACGKSSIMRAVAIHAADRWGCAPVWLYSLRELRDRWNPMRSDQLFLIDDAFGSTSLDPEAADLWNKSVVMLRTAMARGVRFILTSRDYVFKEALPLLKSDELPVARQGEVVIDVGALSQDERRQIVYNHLRMGNQPSTFRTATKPHLMRLTAGGAFLPETARRLGDSAFTSGLDPASFGELYRFVVEPRAYLRSVIESMNADLQNALVVLVVNGSPVSKALTEVDRELLGRLGIDMRTLSKSLDRLDGSFVRTTSLSGQHHWSTRHPTVEDAVSEWMIDQPDLIDLFVRHAPDRSLARKLTCGGSHQGVVAAPKDLWPTIVERLSEPTFAPELALRFILYRCSTQALHDLPALAELGSKLVLRRGFQSPLDGDPAIRLALRLWSRGLLSQEDAALVTQAAITVAVNAFDPYLVRNTNFEEMALALANGPDLLQSLYARHVEAIRTRLRSHVGRSLANYNGDVDRADYFVGVIDLLNALDEGIEADPVAAAEAARATSLIVDWIGNDQTADDVRLANARLRESIFGALEQDNPFSDVDA